MDLLTSPFMVRALIAAMVTGLAAPAIGTYLVQRRLALLGDGIGHICVTGVALGLLTGTSPTLTAVLTAIVGALLIEWIRASGRTGGDVALALLFYGGIAGGLALVSISGSGTLVLQRYLFGSVTTISTSEVIASVLLAAVVLTVSLGLWSRLFAAGNDEDYARTAGLPVGAYNLLVSVMTAVTVSVAMRTVGLLLVSALMIVPVATAQQFSRSFRATLLGAMGLGTIAALVGVSLSAFVDVPPGPTIVLVALAGFAATAPAGVFLARRRRALVPFPEVPVPEYATVEEPHGHRHGPGCGHLAVEHGDHVDYLHDGHRHAVHEEHYDEH